MDYKEQIGAMVDAVIAGKDVAAARAAFHDYSTARMKSLLGTPPSDEPAAPSQTA